MTLEPPHGAGVGAASSTPALALARALQDALADGDAPGGQGIERTMLAAAPDAVLLVDAQGTIVLANAAAGVLTGYAPQALVDQPLDILLPQGLQGRHRQWVVQYFQRPYTRPMGRVTNLRLRHRAGHEVPVDIALGACTVAGAPCAVVFMRDVSEARRLTDALRHQATHDALTGLYNRAQLHELLQLTLRQALRSGRCGAVLLLDLDDFKAINDGHGHAAGDRVLVEVARRLRAHLRETDLVARLGGDEFLVLLPEVHDAAAAETVARKLLRALQQPYAADGCELRTNASIGVALFPDDARDADTLLRCVDLAMYAAKDGGRGGVVRYDARMRHALDARVRLHERLQQALHDGQGLALHYQPQWHVAGERVDAVEALLRWHDPVLGAVSPAQCIAVAERTGLIVPLGDWVLQEACAQVARWRAQGAQVRVAVNVSAQQFRLPDWPQRVQGALHRHGLPGDALELEITETQAMANPQQARATLQHLMALGVQLALDDFGTGHSSLAQLKRLPLHCIKIDREFVRELPDNATDAAMVRGVARLARLLRLRTVAEGVETPAQARHLRRHGVDALQGWLLAPALPAHEVQRWIAADDVAWTRAQLTLKVAVGA